MADVDTLAGNRLLAMIPDDERALVAPEFEPVLHDIRDQIYREGETIEFVYFPLSGVLSLVTQMSDGRAIEVATIGNEGMAGLPVFLQATLTSAHQAFAQVPGESLRMPAGRFNDFVAGPQDGGLHRAMHRYTQALMSMIARAVACNSLHSVEQRASRWLLMTHDRTEGDEFVLTQDFLSQMLGVTRASVNEVARELQDAGAIDYTRGRMTILDRAELESRSCECYGVVREEFDRLLDPDR
ncbi:MAG TPA: Crp/Fnr family transcriptional regulator [Solirubrobacteraceae bacterium]|nr:Crp/Fnr family transcriptional regulator [Solirubrobacteraceae bacterium]